MCIIWTFHHSVYDKCWSHPSLFIEFELKIEWLCRTVYGTERMSHLWHVRFEYVTRVIYSVKYGTLCHIRLDLVFLCSPKRICHLLKNAHKNRKKQRLSHMCIFNSSTFEKKSSSCAHCRPKTLTFIITFFYFSMLCLHTWPQQPLGQDSRQDFFAFYLVYTFI